MANPPNSDTSKNSAQEKTEENLSKSGSTTGIKNQHKKTKTKKSLREHSNPIVRVFAKSGYAIGIVILVIGGVLAFIASILAV